MPQKIVRLTLNSSNRSSGTHNAATFSNIRWDALVPQHTRKIKVRGTFFAPGSNCRDTTAADSFKELMVVKAQFSGGQLAYDESGNTDPTLMLVRRVQSDTTQNAAGNVSYIFEDQGQVLQEINAIPNGDLTVRLYMFNATGAEVPFVKSTGTTTVTNSTDAQPWYMTLVLECDTVNPSEATPNPYSY